MHILILELCQFFCIHYLHLGVKSEFVRVLVVVLFQFTNRHLYFNFVKTQCLRNDPARLGEINILVLTTDVVELRFFLLSQLFGLKSLVDAKADLGLILSAFINGY